MPYADHTPDRRNAETRERILDAAVAVFGEHGVEAGTMKQVAERCSLTDGAIYYYFESKQHLVDSLVAERWQVEPFGLPPIPFPGRTVSHADIDDVLDTAMDAFAENEPFLRLVAQRSFASGLARDVRAVRVAAWEEYIAAHFAGQFDSETQALLVDALMTFLCGVVLDCLIDSGPDFSRPLRDPAYRERIHRLVRVAVPLDRLATLDRAAGA